MCAIKWSDIQIHYEMITMTSLVTVTIPNYLHCYWLYSFCHILQTCGLIRSSYLVILFICFANIPPYSHLETTNLLSLSVSVVFYLFVLCFRFQYERDHMALLSIWLISLSMIPSTNIHPCFHKLHNLIIFYGWVLLLLFSHSVVSNSLWLLGLQHARLPCPSPPPIACSNSCPLSWWCHPNILVFVIPFSSYLHSFPASGSFLMN